MSTTTPRPVAPQVVQEPPDGRAAWTRLLAWSAGVVALVDAVVMMLIGEIIPPLAVGIALTAIGLAALRRWRGVGIGVLGAGSLLMLVGTVPFAVDHLPHAQSGIDFFHSWVSIVGRLIAVGAAVAAWRAAAPRGARRAGAASLAALCVVLAVAAVATIATSGDSAEPGDIVAEVEDAAFPELVEVDAGGALLVDNRDAFRHTFTVEGTAIDVELPALQGARVPVDLAPGDYDLLCSVPGHDFMSGTLRVR